MTQDPARGAEEDDIGALENETIFVPLEVDAVGAEHEEMHQGKDEENDLRDPWFHTREGRAWLAEQGEDGA